MKRNWLLILLCGIIVGCGPGYNYDQVSLYSAAIRDVLIRRGICRDGQDCNNKEMILNEGGASSSGPVHVNVYNVSDPDTANAIIDAARAVRSSAKVGVKLRITASKHLNKPYEQVRHIIIE
jgi:hypothetical protein